MQHISEKWFDGTWWEAQLPKDWNVYEKSAQHVRLKSKNGAVVLIGLRKGVGIHPASKRDSWAKENLSELEEWAYSTTKAEADIVFPLLPSPVVLTLWKRDLHRHVFGQLTGYTYIKSIGLNREVWAGFFGFKDWGLYLRLDAPAAGIDEERKTTSDILSSLEFKA